jgi:hypothetical protein
MGSKFTLDPAGVGEMLKSAAMQAEMHRRAERGKDFAEGVAPYDPANATHYRDAFKVEDRPRDDRACAALVNDDGAAFYIEYGTSKTPAHHVLHRAMDMMGDEHG